MVKMMPENETSCTEPTAGPIIPESETEQANTETKKEEAKMSVQVGQPAPDFEAMAYVGGDFRKIKLSDYKGQWVVLCFYPGDFTFV